MKKNILFATDFSEASYASLDFINEVSNKNDQVTLLHVFPDQGFSNPVPTDEELQREQLKKKKKLEAFAQKLHCKTKVTLIEGNVLGELIRYTSKHNPEVLVICRHKTGFFNRIINGDFQNLLFKHIHCPVVCC